MCSVTIFRISTDICENVWTKFIFFYFSIKCNRSYSDFSLYSMPVKPVILSEELLNELVGVEDATENNMEIDNNGHCRDDFLLTIFNWHPNP